MKMTDERPLWIGDMGKQWTDGNSVDPLTRVDFFRDILASLDGVESILEIGCNRGCNLAAISLTGDYNLYGVDICRYPLKESSQQVVQGDIFNLPFKDDSFDLIFTAGTLLLFDSPSLVKVVEEITRCQRRYFLAVEYGIPGVLQNPKFEVQLRYKDNLERYWDSVTVYWERDYDSVFPGFKIKNRVTAIDDTMKKKLIKKLLEEDEVRSDFLGTAFESCTYWLFEK